MKLFLPLLLPLLVFASCGKYSDERKSLAEVSLTEVREFFKLLLTQHVPVFIGILWMVICRVR